VCVTRGVEVQTMENIITTESSLKTQADYEAAIDQCLAEMQRLQDQIERDQEDIDQLRTETKALLTELRGA
jgi:peptidoglycan hydrolase CwlO-like protein